MPLTSNSMPDKLQINREGFKSIKMDGSFGHLKLAWKWSSASILVVFRMFSGPGDLGFRSAW